MPLRDEHGHLPEWVYGVGRGFQRVALGVSATVAILFAVFVVVAVVLFLAGSG